MARTYLNLIENTYLACMPVLGLLTLWWRVAFPCHAFIKGLIFYELRATSALKLISKIASAFVLKDFSQLASALQVVTHPFPESILKVISIELWSMDYGQCTVNVTEAFLSGSDDIL